MAQSKDQRDTTRQEEQQSRPQATNQPQHMQRASQRTGQWLEPFPSAFAASPFESMRRMMDEMSRIFDRGWSDVGFEREPLAPRAGIGGREAFWSPRVEAFQKEDQFTIRAELPGLKKEDVQVDVTEEALTIHGERKHEQEERREGFYHSERSYGSFHRTIPLPDGVITDSARASFRDGVLEVTMQAPPSEVSRGRRLDISEGSAEGQQKNRTDRK